MSQDGGNEERLALALEAAGLDLWENNLITGEVPRKALKTLAELGYDEQEALSYVEDIFAIVHPDDVEMLKASVGAHLAGTTPQYRCEFRIRAKDGRWVWYANYGKIVDRTSETPGQRFIGVTFNIDDRKLKEEQLETVNRLLEEEITEREQATLMLEQTLEELQEANRAKSHFFAAVSHDLRQPIHAMNLLLDVLAKSDSQDDRERLVQSIKSASLSLTDMLESLLDISRLDAGAVEPCPQAVSSHELISAIDATFSPMALKQGIRFKIWFPHESPTLFVDRQLLMSVLDNIIGNAFKNTPAGGVLVALRPKGDSYVFQVWDTGVGIAEEHLDHIFEEYYQVGNPHRDRSRGIGLGLAIVHRICDLLALRLTCRSRLGRGTVFEVRLPPLMIHSDAAEELPPPPSFNSGAFRGKRFVLVDDDILVADALRESLALHGIEAMAHGTAEDALEDPATYLADYIIVDHQLAGAMNGFEFLDALRERTPSPPKAIVISGNTSDDFIAGAAHRGITFLFKPTSIQTILETLADMAPPVAPYRYV